MDSDVLSASIPTGLPVSDVGMALRFKGISKSYPGLQTLADISIDIHPCEIHGLVGKNGAAGQNSDPQAEGYPSDDGRSHRSPRRFVDPIGPSSACSLDRPFAPSETPDWVSDHQIFGRTPSTWWCARSAPGNGE